MDKPHTSNRNRLSLVKPGALLVDGELNQPKKAVSVSKRSMDAARQNSKALGWLYATVELGWRFLVKSKAGVEPIMGDSANDLFDPAEALPAIGCGLSKPNSNII